MTTDTSSEPEEVYDAISRLHEDADERVCTLRDRRPPSSTVERQLGILKALANDHRLRILTALREGECCVCELQVVTTAPQSTVATHLRTLKDAGLVRSRKKGKWTYYRLADAAVAEILDLATAIEESERS